MGFDRNPLRRRTDRIQANLRVILVAVFVLGGPFVIVVVSHGVYAAGLRTARAQAAWRRAPAVALHVTVMATAWRQPPTAPGPVRLWVRWAAPDGVPRTGEVGYGGHAVRGSVVTVWVDASGRLVHPPLTRATAVARMAGAAMVAPAALALLLCLAGWAVSRVLDLLRMARWEADWRAVEPEWSGRR
jgi:hypothetical protein